MKILYISNKILVADKKSTYLTAAATAAGTTLTVESITGFAKDQILLIGELGNEKTEIIKTDDTTAPSVNTVTLLAGLASAHPIGTKVYIIDYDQVEISWGAAVTGEGDTVLSAGIALQPEQQETQYTDTTKSAGYYFTRFKNTISPATYSEYSDPIPFVGFGADTVGYVIEYALNRNKTEFTDNITHSFCVEEVNACLRYITGKTKRLLGIQEFDYILGQTERGINKFALPSNCYDKNTNKSILSVKLGDEDYYLDYIDKIEFDKKMRSVCYTQVATEGAIGATSLVVDNAYDYPESGTLNIYISNTLYGITYTGITRDTGTFTGIPASGTGAITATIPVDTNVWKGESEGKPAYYSIWDGNLYLPTLPSATYKNKNIYLNYHTAITSIDSDADTLDLDRFDAVKYWLTAIIRDQLKNDGRKNLEDNDYVMFEMILANFIRTAISGQRSKRSPKVFGIKY